MKHLVYNKSNNCLQSMTQTNRQKKKKKNTKENKIKRNKKDTRKQKLLFFFYLHDIFGYVMMDFNFNVKCSQFTHILQAMKAYNVFRQTLLLRKSQ